MLVYEVSKIKKRENYYPGLKKKYSTNSSNSLKVSTDHRMSGGNYSPYKEVHSSKFKRNYKNTVFSPIKPSPILKKTSTVNISDFNRNITFEEKFTKKMEICSSFLKRIPIGETSPTSMKEKQLINLAQSSLLSTQRVKGYHHMQNRIQSGSDLPSLKSFAFVGNETEKANFKSPQLSPGVEGKPKKHSIIISGNPLNKYLTNSLSLRAMKTNNINEDMHSALGFSINRYSKIKEIEEEQEMDEKYAFASLDKSIIDGRSEGCEEELKEEELFPDDIDFGNRGSMMEKSWDYRSINKKQIEDNINENKSDHNEDSNEIKDLLKPSKFILRFENDNAEAVIKFHEDLFAKQKRENYLSLFLIMFVFLYDFACYMRENQKHLLEIGTLTRFGVILIFGFIIRYFNQLFQRRILRKVIIGYYILLSIVMFWNHLREQRNLNINEIAEMLIINSLMQHLSVLLFIDNMILNGIILLLLIIFQLTTITQLGIIVFILVVHLFWLRKNFLLEISKTNLNIANLIKKTQQKTLVRYLLPNHITQQFINKPSSKSDLIEEFADVTILFADIKGFTDFSANNQPHVVVNMLRDLFTEFDKLCLQNDVYKLYTIGDCYVALGLIDANERNPEEEARNVLQFAFSMLTAIKSIRKKNPELEMRIGIHIVKKFCIDIYIVFNFRVI